MTNQELFLFSDLSLSRRLERTEGLSSVAYIEARAQTSPETGAQWFEVAGTLCMFDGKDSPLTQSFGLGIFEPVSEDDIQNIEDFYSVRGSAVNHEVSPLADASVFDLLYDRRYKPIEFTSVMFRQIGPASQDSQINDHGISVRVIDPNEADAWAKTSAEGWSEFLEYAHLMYDLALLTAKRPGGMCFIAEKEGQPIATGAMSIHDGVALLAGASTIPSMRQLGAQNALLNSRLQYAAEHGCDIAMMCALPGSASQRNAERNGFRIAYTRTKWSRS
ncbi:MAG: GNAT family N-acetyltransferase [Acidobacteria bacterium]|nr:GNAT family N-acetyltransferase [Acidobacteriota bacterium]